MNLHLLTHMSRLSLAETQPDGTQESSQARVVPYAALPAPRKATYARRGRHECCSPRTCRNSLTGNSLLISKKVSNLHGCKTRCELTMMMFKLLKLLLLLLKLQAMNSKELTIDNEMFTDAVHLLFAQK